jgi:runt-related transcription factor 1
VGNQRLVYKIKKFLSTLIKFGLDISPQVGEKVRDMVLNLVVSFYFSANQLLF